MSISPQVLCILDAMGLQQYRDHFKVEQISGEILSECDEDMLAHDLRISSKLHRMRLLKVISGKCVYCSVSSSRDCPGPLVGSGWARGLGGPELGLDLGGQG